MSVAEHLQRLEALENYPRLARSASRLSTDAACCGFSCATCSAWQISPALFAEHSALAEACLIFVNRVRGNENDLTIIALGKFGGGEIGYGADLDVLFVGDDIRAAQHLVVAMAQPTAEGSIATLDARLRPEGEKGNLACSLATYEAYYETRAQLWEVQALTRARPVAGPLQDEFMDLARRVWRKAAQRDDLYSQIDRNAATDSARARERG